MRKTGLRLAGLATVGLCTLYFACAALADDKVKAQQLQGKIVKTTQDTVIVETSDRKQVTVYVNPQTKYMMNNKAVQLTDLRVGAQVTAGYVTEGDRFIANSITVGAEKEAPPDKSPPESPPEKATMLEGEIVGIEGKDQLIIKTSDGKEVTVFVDPKTRIALENKERKFTDLRKGTSIGVQYSERDKRFYATDIQDVTLLEGQVVKVVGKDQVVVKTSDGKEIIVFIDPKTRFQLTEQGGTITDLQPGANVNVYYGMRDDRAYARRVFAPRRR